LRPTRAHHRISTTSEDANLSLIKIAVRVTELVTKIKISLPTSFAYHHGFTTLAARLAKLPP